MVSIPESSPGAAPVATRTGRAAIGARPAGVEPEGERSRAKPELQGCATRELIRSCHPTSPPEFDPNPMRRRLIVRDAHLRRKLGRRGFRGRSVIAGRISGAGGVPDVARDVRIRTFGICDPCWRSRRPVDDGSGAGGSFVADSRRSGRGSGDHSFRARRTLTCARRSRSSSSSAWEPSGTGGTLPRTPGTFSSTGPTGAPRCSAPG